ncbi:MAG TPA: hypothetical protein PKC18_11230, partial [Lacipirellulaceae bacterium]|nr:hypothetical protein [Lacipirellulaceae bacterium]
MDPAPGLVNNWSRTPTQPLDDIFGAGELNVYNSYLMLVGGRHAGSTAPPTTVAKSYGWDYQDRKADATVGDIYYSFEIPVGSTATEFSTILAWNVRVTSVGGGGVFDPSHSLQNLDLRLYDSTTSFLGTMLDESVSTVDNVEHIYQTNLGPGLYTLVVSGAASWDYGLAWRMSTKFDEPNADFDGDGTVGGADFLIWQRNLGKLVGALQSEGDANGDGAVDLEDLQLLSQGAMPTPMMQAALAAAAMAAPEPSAGVVAWSMA